MKLENHILFDKVLITAIMILIILHGLLLSKIHDRLDKLEKANQSLGEKE